MVRLGEILLDANVLTKRQLSRALAMQEGGDKRKLGEILDELGYITVEDLADIMMVNGHPQEDRLPVVEEPIAPTLVVPKQPIDISENVVMKTKFALDIKTMITAAVGIATLVGFWYALQADIQEAKELPKIGNIYSQEYPSRPEGYNWPRSYEQYKSQGGQLQTDMDDVLDLLDEYEEKIDELEKQVTNLRIQLANKKDK